MIRARVTAHGREGGVAIEQTVFHVFEMEEGRAAVIRGFLDREEGPRGGARPGQTSLKKLIPCSSSHCWSSMFSRVSSPVKTRTPMMIRTTPPAAMITA